MSIQPYPEVAQAHAALDVASIDPGGSLPTRIGLLMKQLQEVTRARDKYHDASKRLERERDEAHAQMRPSRLTERCADLLGCAIDEDTVIDEIRETRDALCRATGELRGLQTTIANFLSGRG